MSKITIGRVSSLTKTNQFSCNVSGITRDGNFNQTDSNCAALYGAGTQCVKVTATSQTATSSTCAGPA